jgi:uncharacterized protein DUF6572
MTVSNPSVVDIVSYDARTDAVVLSLVEEREWGLHGELLIDLQAKLNYYLAFVLDGQLAQEYPQYVGKGVRFELWHRFELGPLDTAFIERVRREYLDREDIDWAQRSLELDDNALRQQRDTQSH